MGADKTRRLRPYMTVTGLIQDVMGCTRGQTVHGVTMDSMALCMAEALQSTMTHSADD